MARIGFWTNEYVIIRKIFNFIIITSNFLIDVGVNSQIVEADLFCILILQVNIHVQAL